MFLRFWLAAILRSTLRNFEGHINHWARLAAETLRAALLEAGRKESIVARAQAEMQKQIGDEEERPQRVHRWPRLIVFWVCRYFRKASKSTA